MNSFRKESLLHVYSVICNIPYCQIEKFSSLSILFWGDSEAVSFAIDHPFLAQIRTACNFPDSHIPVLSSNWYILPYSLWFCFLVVQQIDESGTSRVVLLLSFSLSISGAPCGIPHSRSGTAGMGERAVLEFQWPLLAQRIPQSLLFLSTACRSLCFTILYANSNQLTSVLFLFEKPSDWFDYTSWRNYPI